MSDNVIPIGGRRKPVAMPTQSGHEHYAGAARCSACGHEWAATAPTGVTRLECPGCRTHRGFFDYPLVDGRAYRFFCGCGGDAWAIETTQFRCMICGATCSHAEWANTKVPSE